MDIQFAHSVDYFAEDALHAHTWVLGVPHAYKRAVKIDGRELADFVGEAGGIEVGFDGADGEDEIGGFNAFTDALVAAVACRVMSA